MQLFTPRFRIEACLSAIRECLERGWTGAGFKTVEFEEAWTRYTGVAHAHFVNSATSGLHLALEVLKRRLGWAADDEVISTPFTFISTNHAILHAGLTPVFADIDHHLCLDPASVEARITPRTRAVMFVGIGGSVGAYADILALCRDRGLALVLDAAHMAGTRFAGAHVGPDADAAVFSFHAVKNLPTADSGMLCLRHPEDDACARRLSWMGIDRDTYSRTQASGNYRWRYDVTDLGYKYHGNAVMAAIGLVQLAALDEDNAYRRALARQYRDAFQGDERIGLIPEVPGCESSAHLFQIRVADREAVMHRLNEQDVFPGVHYRDNTEYPMYAASAGTCPRAGAASREVVSLPLHLALTGDDVSRIVERVRRSLD